MYWRDFLVLVWVSITPSLFVRFDDGLNWLLRSLVLRIARYCGH